MAFHRFIAGRYLFRKKQFTFINVLSMLAILGIAFGVAALIVVMSVFNGFNDLVTGILLDFDPHLKAEPVAANGIAPRAAPDTLPIPAAELRGVSRFVQRKGMIVAKNNRQFVWVKGVETASLASVSNVERKIVLGAFDLRGGSVVLGITLADRLRVLVGDTVTIFSPAGLENILTDPFVTPTIENCRVAGIFQSDNKLYDERYAFLSLADACRLFRLGPSEIGFEVKLRDMEGSDAAKRRLAGSLGSGWSVSTWYDLHRDLYSVMKIERWSAFVLLSLIILVAVFSIFAALTMLVLEKRRDIGVLRALGARAGDVRRIFLIHGLITGLIGLALGLLLGIGLCLLQMRFGLVALGPEFIIPALPVKLRAADVAVVSVATLLLTLAASAVPSGRVRKIDPIEAIRWE